MAIRASIVWFDFSPKRFDMMGQVNAPAIPEVVAMIETTAMAVDAICSSVFAKRIAVPDIVAIASERRNQATRKIAACRNFTATLIVFQSDTQENIV